MGMIDVTEDFRRAVSAACRERGISVGTVTGFTTGGVAGLQFPQVALQRRLAVIPAQGSGSDSRQIRQRPDGVFHA